MGFGAVMAFALKGEPEVQNRFVANLRLITSAVSLGHDESLIVPVGKTGRGGSERYPNGFREYGHLRLSVGLEDPADLIAMIMRERRIEFLGEGLRNNDLMRLLQTIPGKGSAGAKGPNDDGYIWPASSDEKSLNKLWVDN